MTQNKKNQLKKKAIFFSITSIFIIILFTAIFDLNSRFNIKQSQMEATRARIKALNSIMESMENSYFENILKVSSKNALIGLSKYYSEKGFDQTRLEKYIEYALEDVIYDGVLTKRNNELVNLTGYLDPKFTIQNIVKNISSIFNDYGFWVYKLNVNISRSDMSQPDPWTIELKAFVTYDFRDKENIVAWRGTTEIKTNISVYGIYAYDYELGRKSNIGVVTSNWKLDTPAYTEPSVLSKLSRRLNRPDPNLGICSPSFDCQND